MTIEGTPDVESLEGRFRDPEQDGSVPEPYELIDDEFECRGCGLIFSRSCLVDEPRSFCRDCTTLAAEVEPGASGVPQVDGIHHPCPACGALVMVPEHGEVSCGFVCPSCRVHLTMRGGHVRLSWDHREAVAPGVSSLSRTP